MLKHFEWAHDPTGTNTTEQGSCAVLCLACPQLGKNLPEDWESALPETCWLYAFFLVINANFCLACKNISSDQMDPGLNCGLAYFVEEQQYKTFLTDVGRSTGAGTVDCSWHNFKCPCGVSDLQKGEKYVNMDYLFFSTMQHMGDIAVLNVSYNIACQWSKHLWQHMGQYPSMIHLHHHDNKTIKFIVPKFHLPVHIKTCQITYSHNLLKGMGRMDGEVPKHQSITKAQSCFT
ncbi:uncharacterized protein EDB91DRAFT_1240247 [Suillus paluster]|uniref:uncharacterized protein n=1 Tax=Suillus paluster TaxID=48578 RepID=UPI001B886ED8|nr:uncharacterized protein EDB91DRAFT_1240247 [Suillus paluster]KAG1722136.1 hypothetical protein EDB91DRAFT_1240247 [Suillus paluster]